MKNPIHIAVTGAAGQIAYNLLFRIAAGDIFGKDQPIVIHMLEVEKAIHALQGIEMELLDSAFPLLHGIISGYNAEQVFQDVDYAILVGAKPRSKGMERADLLQENAKIFVEQGRGMPKNARVLVVGNPCNTNALVFLHNSNLPSENIRAMTKLDENRAKAQIAIKADVLVSDVHNLSIWGNHSPTMVPDFTNGFIKDKKIEEVITDREWLVGDFMKIVKQRGSLIIEARGLSSAASAAAAAIDAVRDWFFASPKGERYSASVYTHQNPYGIADDLFFSFPLHNGHIVKGIHLEQEIEKMVRASEQELLEERDAISKYLK